MCSRGIERVFSKITPSTEQAVAHRSVAVSSTKRFKIYRAAAPVLYPIAKVNHIQPLTIDEALKQLAKLIKPIQTKETVAVSASLGRIVAEDTRNPVPVPGFANSAMDGYAVRFEDLNAASTTSLVLQGQSLAGHPFPDAILPGHAIRIFTGAKLPEAADTIVIQENVTQIIEDSDHCDALVETERLISIDERPKKGAYVRPVGHDLAANSRLFSQGTRMRAFEIAAATTSGLQNLKVFKRLRIGVFATGDELRTPGEKLEPGQIYESNRAAISQLLTGLPLDITDLGILPDDKGATHKALAHASQHYDALITSGGVSVGDADFVRDAIAELGAIDFWRLNLRPGKPFAFGHLDHSGGRCLVFGLPGNPVSTIVTLLLLVKPALWHMAGNSGFTNHVLRAPLAQLAKHSPGRNEYQRGRLEQTASGTVVRTTSDQSSNRLQSFADANCLFLLPGETSQLEEGQLVDVLPFEGLS